MGNSESGIHENGVSRNVEGRSSSRSEKAAAIHRNTRVVCGFRNRSGLCLLVPRSLSLGIVQLNLLVYGAADVAINRYAVNSNHAHVL
jgi:hypothetical protein